MYPDCKTTLNEYPQITGPSHNACWSSWKFTHGDWQMGSKINPCSLILFLPIFYQLRWINLHFTVIYRPFSYCIDQAGLGAFTAKSGRKHYNPPPLTIMWMNFDSPNFPSLCSLSAIILFQTCSNKCILYVLLFHKCIKIKYKMINMYGVFLWLVPSSSRWNTIHSHRNYHVQTLSVRVGEFCHPARSR